METVYCQLGNRLRSGWCVRSDKTNLNKRPLFIIRTRVVKHIIVCGWEHTGSNRGPSACKADA